MTTTTDDRLWTVAEIAALLRVSPMTVYRIAGRGQFPGAFRVGSGFRVPGSGLKAYMRNNQIGAGGTS